MPGEVMAVARAYDLALWLLPHIAQFDRQHRFTLGNRLEDATLALRRGLDGYRNWEGQRKARSPLRIGLVLWSAYEGKLWQRGFYEPVLRGEEDWERIREYIRMNPRRWQVHD